MEWLELVNMEYGECIVLGGRDRSILMVDCGSVSQKLREGDVPLEAWVETLADRYDFAMDRFFLLIHYHRDHLWGFQKLLESRLGYFTRVYLPRTPLDRNGSPQLLEFALFAYLFLPPQSDSFQVNTWCVRAFQALEKHLGADRIFTVGAGDRFHFDGVDYQVLWPRVEDYPFDPALGAALEELNVLFSSPFQPESFQRFMALKEEFLTVYRRCGEAFSVSGRELPDKRRAFVEHLNRLLGDLEDLREDLNLSSQAHDAREILQNPLYAGAYSAGVNSASVVFHNLRKGSPSEQDLLLTGDATPETLAEIADQLYDGYYILKAPHHGTASGYSNLFADMSAAHILISNGEYHAGGAIAQAYIDREDSLRHCTGTGACKWFRASQGCCNRLCTCYDQDPAPGLALKCRAAVRPTGASPGCRIRVVGPTGERGCFCDTLRP